VCTNPTYDAARWQERLAHLQTIVAESDGLLAGFASYTLDGYLDFLFTHPAFARRGVASSLYHRVESVLRAVSTPRVTSLAATTLLRPPRLPTRQRGVRRVPWRLPPTVCHAQATPQ